MGNKKLLIVEDNLSSLTNGYQAAINKGYGADVACDLEDALTHINTRKYDGIVTDMCFHERGIRIRDAAIYERDDPFTWIFVKEQTDGDLNPPDNFSRRKDELELVKKFRHFESEYKKIPLTIKEAYKHSFEKSKRIYDYGTHYIGETSEKLRKDIVKASIEALEKAIKEHPNFIQSFYDDKSTLIEYPHYREETHIENKEDILNGNSREWYAPATGYFISQEGIKRNIPVRAITYIGHSRNHLYAAFAVNLILPEELSCLEDFLSDKDAIFNRAIITQKKSKKIELYERLIDSL